MKRRTRRWLVILVCLGLAAGIPVAIWALGSPSPVTTIPAPDSACAAATRLAELGTKEATEEARKAFNAIVGSTSATQSELGCALTGLSAMKPADPGPCGAALKLAEEGKLAAALAAYEALAVSGETDEQKICGKAGGDLLRPVVAAATTTPRCDAAVAFLSAGFRPEAARLLEAVVTTEVATREFDCARALIPFLDAKSALADVPSDPPPPSSLPRSACADGDPRPACDVATRTASALPVSLPDQTFARVNHALTKLPWVSVSIPDSWKPGVIVVAFVVPLGLLVAAWRQYKRWRLERIPGPVKIETINPPADDDKEKTLAEHLRERLAKAGVYPPGAVPGPLGEAIVDAADVVSATSPQTTLGRVITTIRNAVTIQVGYKVTATAQPVDGAKQLIVQLQTISGDKTLWIRNFSASSYANATESAALAVYLTIVNEDEIIRRTPKYLRWTSDQAVSSYQEGLDRRAVGDIVGAGEAFDDAIRDEPAHVQPTLERSRTSARLAFRTHKDRTLSPPGTASKSVADHWVESATHALLALRRSPAAVETNAQAALVLSYIEYWSDAFIAQWMKNGCPQGSLAHILASHLEQSRSSEQTALAGQLRSTPSESVDIRPAIRSEAIVLWERTRDLAGWREDNVRWWHLSTRRSGFGAPIVPRPARLLARTWAVGGLIGTICDRAIVPREGLTDALRARRDLNRAYRRTKRWWRRRSPGFDLAAYNLASGYARAARFYRLKGPQLGASPREAEHCEKRVRDCLDLWESVESPLRLAELRYLLDDPDFVPMNPSDRGLDHVTQARDSWVAQFPPFDATAAEVWSGFWECVATGAQARARFWLGRQPIDLSTRKRAFDALRLIEADRAAWAALSSWLHEPARESKRKAWTKASADAANLPDIPAAAVAAGGATRDVTDLARLREAIVPQTGGTASVVIDIGQLLRTLQVRASSEDFAAVIDACKVIAPKAWSTWVALASFASGSGELGELDTAILELRAAAASVNGSMVSAAPQPM